MKTVQLSQPPQRHVSGYLTRSSLILGATKIWKLIQCDGILKIPERLHRLRLTIQILYNIFRSFTNHYPTRGWGQGGFKMSRVGLDRVIVF